MLPFDSSHLPYNATKEWIVLSSVIAAVLVGFLLAIHGSRFDDLNPILYNSLIKMFSW
jgi:hypothetical protein